MATIFGTFRSQVYLRSIRRQYLTLQSRFNDENLMGKGEIKFGLDASDTAIDDEVTIEKLKRSWNIMN